MTDLEGTLRALGIGRQYKGHAIAVHAVELALEDADRLVCVRSGILMPLGEMLQRDWRALERNLRTAACRAWEVNPTLMEKIAGYPLQKAPTTTEFLEMLVNYCEKDDSMQEHVLPM